MMIDDVDDDPSNTLVSECLKATEQKLFSLLEQRKTGTTAVAGTKPLQAQCPTNPLWNESSDDDMEASFFAAQARKQKEEEARYEQTLLDWAEVILRRRQELVLSKGRFSDTSAQSTERVE